MVDVGHKPISEREAVAEAKVRLGRETFELVKSNQIKKGDVLTVAKIAGIQAAKQTAHLIPLCHQLNLNKVHLDIRLDQQDYSAHVQAKVKVDGKTGVEMEALTAVSVASLTIYDMCKAVSKQITIERIGLLKKSGGKTGEHNLKEEID